MGQIAQGQCILTIIRAVIDSFIHRFSSRRWPMTIQAQRRATNKFMETTEAWSEVDTICNFETTELISKTILSTLHDNNCTSRFYTIQIPAESPSSNPIYNANLFLRGSHFKIFTISPWKKSLQYSNKHAFKIFQDNEKK